MGSDPSRFDDLHLFTAWDDRVLRAYMRRTFGPKRHPPKATKIYLRYEPQIQRASAWYEWQQREEVRRDWQRYCDEQRRIKNAVTRFVMNTKIEEARND